MRQLSDSDVLANIEPNEVYSTLHLYNEIVTRCAVKTKCGQVHIGEFRLSGPEMDDFHNREESCRWNALGEAQLSVQLMMLRRMLEEQ